MVYSELQCYKYKALTWEGPIVHSGHSGRRMGEPSLIMLDACSQGQGHRHGEGHRCNNTV